jgi:2-methylcitrate dehydratase PrpD
MADVNKATEATVDFILAAKLASFPEPVIREGKRCLVDGFAVILAGYPTEASRIMRRELRNIAGKRESTVIASDGLLVPAQLAALANATSGHALDYDDTQLSNSPDRIFGLLTHPTVPSLAAALAAGEKVSASGGRFLEAFLTGFEVECKIAEAIHPEHYKRGFHSSGTIGTFGSVGAAAKILGLDREHTARALGIAASMASGIRVNFGTMTKPLHMGRAAENGVLAAELAAEGFTADARALDGPWGFFQVFGGGYDPERIIGRLGKPYNIVDPGVSIKPYPCGSLGHPTMDAMLRIVQSHDLRPEQIRAIRVRAGSNILEPLRYRKPVNELEAKFSLPFMVSAIALRRRAGLREFTDEFVRSEPVVKMMERVELVHDRDIEALGFEKMRSRVEVETTDGKRFAEPAETYRGGPDRPFTRAELRQKFEECAEGVIPSAVVPRALAAIERVEELASIRELTRLLANPKAVAER